MRIFHQKTSPIELCNQIHITKYLRNDMSHEKNYLLLSIIL